MTKHTQITLVGKAAVVSLLLTLSLSGCSDARRALGYDKAPPDEFTVVSRAPLSQPPDFTLRPPQLGVPRPQEGTTADKARNAIVANSGDPRVGTDGIKAIGHSDGERVLLTKAGADRAIPQIRRIVNEETANLVDGDKSFTDKILFWQTKPLPGEPLDANQEARRLQDNNAIGKPPTDGDSPQIVRRKKGWLEGIF